MAEAARVETAKRALAAWVQKAAALESVLEQGGRGDLLVAVSRIRAAAAAASEDGVRAEAVAPLLGKAFAEVRRCVVDVAQHPDESVFRLLDDAAGVGRSASLRDSTVQAPGARRPPSTPLKLTVPAPAEVAARLQEEGRSEPPPSWAKGVLAELGNADDNVLDSIAASIEAISALPPARTPKIRDDLGTLREPIGVPTRKQDETMTAPLGAGAGAVAAARVLMKGELQPGLLADLIQLFSQNTETGRLVVEANEAEASVFFKEGRIVDASFAGEVGEKAFFRTMLVQKGRFSYQRGAESPEVRIQRSAQHLIMDTLRLIDEAT